MRSSSSPLRISCINLEFAILVAAGRAAAAAGAEAGRAAAAAAGNFLGLIFLCR